MRIAMTLLLVLTLVQAGASEHGLYDRVEVAMTNSTGFGNPFTETELRLEVTAPSGRRLGGRFTWYGFHDGNGSGGQSGNVWKFRLLLDTPGSWSVDAGFFVPGTSTRNGPQQSFSFTVGASPSSAADRGHVRIDPRNPMRFAYDDGTPWTPFPMHGSFLLNQDYATATDWIDRHLARGVDALAVRFHVEGWWNDYVARPYYHFRSSGGGAATSWPGASGFDYSRFDVGSWRYNERIIDYAQDQGMKLFIWFGLSGKNRQYASYGPLDHSVSGGVATLGPRQRQFIRYFLARWATYSCFWHWTVDSEWEETGGAGTDNQAFQIAYAKALREGNPWRTLVTDHSLRDWTMGGSSQGWDLATLQKRVGNSDSQATADARAAIEGNDHHGIPVFNEEGVWGLDATRTRIASLTSLFAGGYSHYACTSESTGVTSSWMADWSSVHQQHQDAALELGRLTRFFNRGDIDVNACSVAHELVSLSGGNLALCLADPGQRYYVWLDAGGSASLDLRGASGSYRVTRYDSGSLPASGGGVDLGTLSGGAWRALGAAPASGFGNDWLYVVERSDLGNNLTVIAPNGGESLTAGGSAEVRWSSAGTSGRVEIHCSTDGGGSWQLLAGDSPDDGSQVVSLPSATSEQALIRVRDVDLDPSDESDAPFRLIAAADTTPPSLSIAAPAAGSTVGGAFELRGSASDDSGVARVEYRLDGGSWRLASGTTSWRAQLSGLSSGSHRLDVRATDSASPANTSAAISRSVTVDADAPLLSAIAVAVTSSGATITWTSDEPSDSRIQYGTSSGIYEGETGVVERDVTSHRVVLDGLQPATRYVYIIITADALGNTRSTAEASFTTLASEPAGTPLITIEAVSSGKTYPVLPAAVGSAVYIDRAFAVQRLGAGFLGQPLIQTANNDKTLGSERHIQLRSDRDALLYVCYDDRASVLPSWLDGWEAVSDPDLTIEVNDGASPYRIFRRALPAATSLSLGGNAAGGGNGGSHYLLLATAAGSVEPPPPAIQLAINFQPAAAPIPAGWLADTSQLFGDRGNGVSYGWTSSFDQTRDRNSAKAPDQVHDTLNHLQKNGARVWELALPDGDYLVTILRGDPSFTDQVNHLLVEGVRMADPDGQDHFDQDSVQVTVSDGRLTVAPAADAQNAKICAIEVSSAVGN